MESKAAARKIRSWYQQYKFNHYELYGDGWLAGTHTVFRYKNYVFVGDEVFPGYFDISTKERIPVRGILHVMDVTDIEHPREVANYEVPEGGMHNVWPDNDILYPGRLCGRRTRVDISGELRGNLYEQGREIASFFTGDPRVIARICRSRGARSLRMD